MAVLLMVELEFKSIQGLPSPRRRHLLVCLARPATTRANHFLQVSKPLEPFRGEEERLAVNRHFDLYADVDLGKPHRVPLVVRLYLGNHAPDNDDPTQEQFARLLKDTFLQLFPAPIGEDTVLLEPYTQYDRLFTFAQVLDKSHLDHTLVFQVDEFWSPGRNESFYPLSSYWRDVSIAWTAHEIEPVSRRLNESVQGTVPLVRLNGWYCEGSFGSFRRELILVKRAPFCEKCGFL